jgi:YHS domain-containing protein
MPSQPHLPGPRAAWPAAPAETAQGTNFEPITNTQPTIVSSPSVESHVVPASQAPPVTLDGFCAVTLIEKGAWQKADPRFGAIHRGQTYLFLSSAEQRRFLANPDHYVLPPAALDGYCPVTLRDGMKWQKGDRQQLAIHRGRTYFFAGPPERESFLRNPDAYAPMLSGYDPVRLAQRGEAVEGKRAYGLRTPDGRIVLFADEQALEQYKKSPGAYTAAAYQAFQRSQGGTNFR